MMGFFVRIILLALDFISQDIANMFQSHPTPYQACTLANIIITVKRVDMVHPNISGNKFYKLKYNLIEARERGYNKIISFGGAYSNHIYALAHACHEYGFDSIGMIRGQELADKPLNPTLQTAQTLGMKLHFISREAYRNKHTSDFIGKLQAKYPNAYIIPEGGTNTLAVKGCAEILTYEDTQNFDIIVLAVGTGGTMAGVINASHPQQKVIGFSALNSDYQAVEIEQWTHGKSNWQLIKDDKQNGFGGYGRYNDELLAFIHNIKQQSNIPLEPIYTGKALYRLKQMIQQEQIEANKRILFIHTGGLQAFESPT